MARTTLTTMVRVYPDHSYGDVISGPGNHIIAICDGKSAWLKFPDASRCHPNSIIEFVRGLVPLWRRLGCSISQAFSQENSPVSLIGEEEIDGKKTHWRLCHQRPLAR